MNPINAYTTLEHPGRMRIESWPRWMRDSHGEWAETDPRWVLNADGLYRLTGAPYGAVYNPARGEIALTVGARTRTLTLDRVGVRGDAGLISSTPLDRAVARASKDRLSLVPAGGFVPSIVAGPDQIHVVADDLGTGAVPRGAKSLALGLLDTGDRIGRIVRDDEREIVEGDGTLEERIPVARVSDRTLLNLTLSLVEGAGIEDTYLYSSVPDGNYGSAIWMFAQTNVYYILIRADISGLPPGALVSSAILSLWDDTAATLTGWTFRTHKVLRAWVESQATYNSWAAGQAWAAAGMQSGTDYVAAHTAETTFVNSGWTQIDVTSDVAAGSATWVLRNLADAGRACWDASEHTVPARRPYMTIEYTLPGGGLFRPLFGPQVAGAF